MSPAPRSRSGRHEKHLEAEPVEQVRLEFALRRHARQVGVGRADDPHVHVNLFAGAHPLEAAVLDDPQDFLLQRHRHLSDFVEKRVPPLRRLEASRPGGGPPR